MLAVSIDVDADMYHRFLKQHGVNLLTVRDPEQKSSSLYGTSGWPETYIIDRNGVLSQVRRARGLEFTEITEFLSKL